MNDNDLKNVVTTKYVRGQLTIKRADARKLLYRYSNRMAEVCFLYNLDLSDYKDDDEELVIEHPDWNSCFSRMHLDIFERALSKTKGSANIVLNWSDGTQTGYTIRDGLVRRKQVARVVEG